MYVGGAYAWSHVEVRGELVGLGSLPPPCGFRLLNSVVGLAASAYTPGAP